MAEARAKGLLEEESIQSIGTEERKVIFASSLGTVFEWYDFYLYATLAPFFAALFFPTGNATAALLSAFATYAAGFLVRPFGALVFGRVGDLVGRKYTFLVTIVVMGFSTFAVGLLPTFKTIGWAAPVLLVSLRLLQGLALGGEYGGAATYVAEHAPMGKRGYDTSWIQTTATLGFFLSLLVIGLARVYMDAKAFAEWGWRIPFWMSLILLVFSVYIRLKLHESPIFQKMKAEGKGSKSPLTDSFLKYPNNKYVLLALIGATAGQGVVWYTGQFYALFFLIITLKLDYISAYTLIGVSLLIGTPFFIVFGWLSDRIGRLKIILAGCLIAAVTYFPLFQGLTHYVNPNLEDYSAKTPITVAATDCEFHLFVGPWSKFSDCDGRGDRRHLLRPLVPDRRFDHDAGDRRALPLRNPTPGHPHLRPQHAALSTRRARSLRPPALQRPASSAGLFSSSRRWNAAIVARGPGRRVCDARYSARL